MYQVLIFLLMLLTWVIFSGKLDLFHLALGLLSCALVTWMSSHMFFENRTRSMSARLRELVGVMHYLRWLLWQIVLANIHILQLALSPTGLRHVSPRIIRFRTGLRSDFARFALAQSITLTPGTVTIKISGDEFFVHAISQVAADGLDGSMEQKIAEIFEPDAKLELSPRQSIQGKSTA